MGDVPMAKSNHAAKTHITPGEIVATGKLASRFLQRSLKSVQRRLKVAAWEWQDDDEHVHQLRVSARRALAAMHFFQELIPDSDCRWFRKMLKAVLRKTREARELDVLIKDYITAKAQLQKLLQTTKKPRDRENLRRLINRMNRRISEQTALYRLWSKSRGRRKVVECLEVIREQVAGDQAGR